jgi:hypothetical protein
VAHVANDPASLAGLSTDALRQLVIILTATGRDTPHDQMPPAFRDWYVESVAVVLSRRGELSPRDEPDREPDFPALSRTELDIAARVLTALHEAQTNLVRYGGRKLSDRERVWRDELQAHFDCLSDGLVEMRKLAHARTRN